MYKSIKIWKGIKKWNFIIIVLYVMIAIWWLFIDANENISSWDGFMLLWPIIFLIIWGLTHYEINLSLKGEKIKKEGQDLKNQINNMKIIKWLIILGNIYQIIKFFNISGVVLNNPYNMFSLSLRVLTILFVLFCGVTKDDWLALFWKRKILEEKKKIAALELENK